MTEVACTVKSCFFNAVEDQICLADRILVRNRAEEESARIDAGSIGEDYFARTSAETLCKTFRPRDEETGKDNQ